MADNLTQPDMPLNADINMSPDVTNISDFIKEIINSDAPFAQQVKERIMMTIESVNSSLISKIDTIRMKDDQTIADVLGLSQDDLDQSRGNVLGLSDKIKKYKVEGKEETAESYGSKRDTRFFEEEKNHIVIGDISKKAMTKLGALLAGISVGTGAIAKANKEMPTVYDKVKEEMFSGSLPSVVGRFTGAAFILGGLLWTAFDAFKGYLKSEQWGTSKVSSILGGMLAGTKEGKPGMGANAAKWALFGAGIGTFISPGVGTILGALLGAGLGAFFSFIGGQAIAQKFDMFGNWIKGLPDWWKEKVSPRLEAAGKWMREVLYPKYILPFTEWLYEKMKEFFTWILIKIDDAKKWLESPETKEKITKFFNFIGKVLKKTFDFIWESLKDAWTWLTSTENQERLSTFFKFIGQTLRDTFEWIGDKIEAAGTWLSKKENQQLIADFFLFLGERLGSFFTYLKEKMKKFGTWVTSEETKENIVNFFKQVGDIFEWIGEKLSQGWKWIADENNRQKVWDALQTLSDFFKNMFTWVSEKSKTLLDPLWWKEKGLAFEKNMLDIKHGIFSIGKIFMILASGLRAFSNIATEFSDEWNKSKSILERSNAVLKLSSKLSGPGLMLESTKVAVGDIKEMYEYDKMVESETKRIDEAKQKLPYEMTYRDWAREFKKEIENVRDYKQKTEEYFKRGDIAKASEYMGRFYNSKEKANKLYMHELDLVDSSGDLRKKYFPDLMESSITDTLISEVEQPKRFILPGGLMLDADTNKPVKENKDLQDLKKSLDDNTDAINNTGKEHRRTFSDFLREFSNSVKDNQQPPITLPQNTIANTYVVQPNFGKEKYRRAMDFYDRFNLG